MVDKLILEEMPEVVKRFSERKMTFFITELFNHPVTEAKNRYHHYFEQLNRDFTYTPDSFARNVIVGTYKLLADKYRLNFDEDYENPSHHEIKESISTLKR